MWNQICTYKLTSRPSRQDIRLSVYIYAHLSRQRRHWPSPKPHSNPIGKAPSINPQKPTPVKPHQSNPISQPHQPNPISQTPSAKPHQPNPLSQTPLAKHHHSSPTLKPRYLSPAPSLCPVPNRLFLLSEAGCLPIWNRFWIFSELKVDFSPSEIRPWIEA